jgi:feruloyl esterase
VVNLPSYRDSTLAINPIHSYPEISSTMASSPAIQNCTPGAIPSPSVFGAQFVDIIAQPVLNFTNSGFDTPLWLNHGLLPNTSVDFCNITLTHTHPGKNDTLRTQIWLPLNPKWNNRMLMAGGGGWSAGFEAAFSSIYGSLTEGYATLTVDGGVDNGNSSTSKAWAQTSPGNVDYDQLQNFVFNGLIDGAMAGKQVIENFYGSSPDYSYWSGCSQGGRQGYMFAQRFPDVFDGIAAAAPAINWNPLFFSALFPKQVLYELAQNGLKEFPHECEFLSLRQAAIAACDGNDGLVDGLVSDPDMCNFDPRSLIGSPVNCSSSGGPSAISESAALAMHAQWNGAETSNGSSLWYPYGYEADPTSFIGTLVNTCSSNGTCVPFQESLFTDWLRLFVKKNPNYDSTNMTRQEYVSAYKAGTREYNSIIGTDDANLEEFRAAGGKLLTYHGLVIHHLHNCRYIALTNLV